jgi:hypothetical protein
MNVTREQWREIYRAFRSSEGRWNPWADRKDPLEVKAELAARIREQSSSHLIVFCAGGTDCDGQQWTNTRLIPANVVAYLHEIDQENKWADGPFGVSFRRPTPRDFWRQQ